jgi:hypothetical protein
VARWLALCLGLAIAVLALYLLASGGDRRPVGDAPPLGEIDDASRARLERVLEDADRRPGPAP